MTTIDRTITMFFIALVLAFVITGVASTFSPTPWSPVGKHNEKSKTTTAPISPGQAT